MTIDERLDRVNGGVYGTSTEACRHNAEQPAGKAPERHQPAACTGSQCCIDELEMSLFRFQVPAGEIPNRRIASNGQNATVDLHRPSLAGMIGTQFPHQPTGVGRRDGSGR